MNSIQNLERKISKTKESVKWEEMNNRLKVNTLKKEILSKESETWKKIEILEMKISMNQIKLI